MFSSTKFCSDSWHFQSVVFLGNYSLPFLISLCSTSCSNLLSETMTVCIEYSLIIPELANHLNLESKKPTQVVSVLLFGFITSVLVRCSDKFTMSSQSVQQQNKKFSLWQVSKYLVCYLCILIPRHTCLTHILPYHTANV